MNEKYISEQVLDELPRPLINFLWYLWDVYCDPRAECVLLLLQPSGSSQKVTIPEINKAVEQDFGVAIDATIVICKDGAKYLMSRQ